MDLTYPNPLAPVAFTANSDGISGFPWAEVEMKTVEKRKLPALPKAATKFSGSQLLLRAQDLCKKFGGQVVLNRVSVELSQGEVVLLRGANGSGKTTLLNILTGNLEPDAGAIELFTNETPEAFHFPKPWWQNFNPRLRFTPERLAQAGVGRTWQDIRLFSTQNLLDNIAIATPNQLGENPAWAILRRSEVLQQEKNNLSNAQTMLQDLGLQGRETSSADKVSLGQSKRVAIARAVQAGARILFLDEPLAGLDAAGIAEVMQLLKQLAYEHKVTLVIVEHIFNIPQILDLATKVWTLEGGKLTVEFPEAVQAEVKNTPGSSLQGWIKLLAGTNGKIQHQQLTGGAVLSTITPSEQPDFEVLSVEDLVVYRGNRLVIGEQDNNGCVRGLSFKLYKGQLSILQAPNGWGKTTLMEAIAGLIPINRGIIRLNGLAIEELPTWERIKLGLSLLQSRNNTCSNLTVRESLNLAKITKIPPDLQRLSSKKIANLSGGERQKVAMYCTLQKSENLLLDEPFAALDAVEFYNSLQKVIHLNKNFCFIFLPKVIPNF